MACAGTLKRHLEFEPLMPQNSPKRMCLRPPSTPTSFQQGRGFHFELSSFIYNLGLIL